MLIRPATPDDAADCLDVYGPFVDDTAVSFEQERPSQADYARRIERVSRTHAFLVAEERSKVVGFAYAGVHRERHAYRWATEVSVYLGPEHRGRGLGRALYEPLFALLQEQGYRMLLAGVTLPNPASVGLHQSLGFEDVGVYRRIGWKVGSWHDVMWLARQLGSIAAEPDEPPSPGAPVRLAEPIAL